MFKLTYEGLIETDIDGLKDFEEITSEFFDIFELLDKENQNEILTEIYRFIWTHLEDNTATGNEYVEWLMEMTDFWYSGDIELDRIVRETDIEKGYQLITMIYKNPFNDKLYGIEIIDTGIGMDWPEGYRTTEMEQYEEWTLRTKYRPKK